MKKNIKVIFLVFILLSCKGLDEDTVYKLIKRENNKIVNYEKFDEGNITHSDFYRMEIYTFTSNIPRGSLKKLLLEFYENNDYNLKDWTESCSKEKDDYTRPIEIITHYRARDNDLKYVRDVKECIAECNTFYTFYYNNDLKYCNTLFFAVVSKNKLYIIRTHV